MTKQRFSVIIMNDRTSVRPEKMIENIKNQHDLYLLGVTSTTDQVRELATGEVVDIIIFAGYQKNERNYNVVDAITTDNHKPIAVMWAIPDEYIDIVCRENGIPFQFDRQRSVSEFLEFLHIIAR